MDEARLAQTRARLVALRDELVAAGDHEIPPARTDAVSQPDEDAAPLTEMTQAIASNRNRERAERLAQIREALSRLDDEPEDFGLCEECDEEIRPRRIELMPWVRFCVRCQEKFERDGQVTGGRKNLTDYR